jgi:hypothetical protein
MEIKKSRSFKGKTRRKRKNPCRSSCRLEENDMRWTGDRVTDGNEKSEHSRGKKSPDKERRHVMDGGSCDRWKEGKWTIQGEKEERPSRSGIIAVTLNSNRSSRPLQ